MRRQLRAGDLAEIAHLKEAPWPSVATAVDVLALPGTWAVIVFRIGSTMHHRGFKPLSRICYFMNIVLFGSELHNAAVVQPGLVLPHPNGVAFGGQLRIGVRCKLLRHAGAGGLGNPKRPGMPVIGDDVWFLDSAKALGPVTIGDRSMIGADALVADDVPADMFVFGPKKSTEMRPIAELGIGDKAEREQGYGIAGRNEQRAARSTNGSTYGSPTNGSSNGSSNGGGPGPELSTVNGSRHGHGG
ncbi:MAG: serine O-acetyltransferase [Acidimicrobiales bacterium]